MLKALKLWSRSEGDHWGSSKSFHITNYVLFVVKLKPDRINNKHGNVCVEWLTVAWDRFSCSMFSTLSANSLNVSCRWCLWLDGLTWLASVSIHFISSSIWYSRVIAMHCTEACGRSHLKAPYALRSGIQSANTSYNQCGLMSRKREEINKWLTLYTAICKYCWNILKHLLTKGYFGRIWSHLKSELFWHCE